MLYFRGFTFILVFNVIKIISGGARALWDAFLGMSLLYAPIH